MCRTLPIGRLVLHLVDQELPADELVVMLKTKSLQTLEKLLLDRTCEKVSQLLEKN